MALHLNLNHEIERLKVVSKRDPLKITMWVLGLIGVGMAAFYFNRLTEYSAIKAQLANKRAELASLEPKARAAKARAEELAAKAGLSIALNGQIEKRFYWAPFLEQVTAAIPEGVQLSKISGESKGEEVKACKIAIEGLAAGEDPRKVAEDLRADLAEKLGRQYKKVSATFRMLEDSSEKVRLGGADLPTASFAINLEFQSGEAPQPTTPPPRRTRQK